MRPMKPQGKLCGDKSGNDGWEHWDEEESVSCIKV